MHSERRCICNHSKRTVHLQQFEERVQFGKKVRSPNETRGIDSLRKYVMVELFVQAGQFGFVASGLLPKRVGRAHLGSSQRGEAVRRGGGGVLQRQGGGGALLCRGGGGGVCLRRDQAAARMPRPSTFFKASRLKISLCTYI